MPRDKQHQKEYMKAYHEEKKESENAKRKARREANAEKEREYKKKHYTDNSEKYKAYSKARYYANRESAIAVNKKWYAAHPGANKSSKLKHAYGITLEEYNKILEDQNYACAICRIPASTEKRSLAVDHDHKSGKVRGLLCVRCNQMIGCALESKETLYSAIDYLVKHAIS